MASVTSKDTKPELTVRRALHAAGLRYRLHRRDLPGCPDLVFPSRRLALFVHGCFWHQHDNPDCPVKRHAGGHNTAYWTAKLERNAARDRRHMQALGEAGWHAWVVWECETRQRAILEQLARRIADLGA
jgi:DNA mismatch endonuclease (patch repair protein)